MNSPVMPHYNNFLLSWAFLCLSVSFMVSNHGFALVQWL